MIYVHRDWSIVPQKLLDDLSKAASELDAIQEKSARKEFIRQNAYKWTALREYLHQMSHDKCWYSESKEAVSLCHVDHYRPHGRAKQAEKDYTEGYSWLAFEADNYRLAGGLCNTLNQEHSEETVGKGDWFPLFDSATRASLANRSCSSETPLLLDPTDPDDAEAIIFNEDGAPVPAPGLDQAATDRVQLSIRCLGLKQSMLDRSRRSIWLQCYRAIRKYERITRKPKGDRTPEETEIARDLAAELTAMSRAENRFSAVTRSCLTANRLSRLIVRNELLAISAEPCH